MKPVPEYVCAFEITRTFTAEDVAHNPDPEEVMEIFVRQVECALRTMGGVVGTISYRRLLPITMESWA